MQKRKLTHGTLARASLAAAVAALAGSAQAMNFTFGETRDWNLDWDTTTSYTAQWRVEKQDDDKFKWRSTGDPIADAAAYAVLINANDGNNNFNRSLVQNKASVVSEMDLSWRGDYGVFLRGRAYYDDVYDSRTDHSEEDYLTYNNALQWPNGDADFREFPDNTVDEHRDRLEMLDYFVYAGGTVFGDRLYNLRIGSQVINWGEATFTSGINGLQNRADVIARNTPGVEVKEILLPTGSIYGQIDLTPSITLEGYYQYEWKKTELNGVGSYFSDRDFLGPGARHFLIPLGTPDNILAIPRTPDEEASDDGQWGTAMHWFTDGGSDWGIYYINAHNKSPAYQVNYDASGILPESYTIKYFEDIEGYAASFTTVWGITNVQGEVSYKDGVPVVLLNGDPEEGELISWQFGGSHVLEPSRLYDDANLTFEVAGAHVDSHDSSELRFDDHGYVVNLRLELVYNNIQQGLDLKVPIFFRRGLDGVMFETEMVEDSSAFNIEFQFVYLSNFTTKLGYTNFWDGGENNLISDRDNVSINFSYSF